MMSSNTRCPSSRRTERRCLALRSSAWLRFVALVAPRPVAPAGDEAEAALPKICERASSADEGPGPVLERLHLADLAFAFLLSEWRPTVIEQFEHDHVPSLVAAARRATPTLDAAEIVQEVRVHVLVGTEGSPPKIRDYRGEGKRPRGRGARHPDNVCVVVVGSVLPRARHGRHDGSHRAVTHVPVRPPERRGGP